MAEVPSEATVLVGVVNDENRGFREENAVVLGQPVTGVAKSDLFSSKLYRQSNQSGVNDHQLGFVRFHQLDELGIALKLPVGLDHAVFADGEVNLLQLFFELHKGLIAIQENDRALLHWNVITPDDKGLTGGYVLCQRPSDMDLPSPPAP